MKKLSFLFVALALVGFITLSSCKSTTQPTEESTEEVVVEEPIVTEEAVDTTAVETESMEEEVPAE